MSLISRCFAAVSGCYPPLFFGQKYRRSKELDEMHPKKCE